MDIANYLSELLGQRGEISVPGLGYFVHVRVGAAYNDAERRFYPPGFKIQFDPQTIDGDDTLTTYIADKKKISLASSKYFTDKYITALKQEATLQEVPFADLGWFHMDRGVISFKSRVSNSDSVDFYGYEPISIKKINQTAEPETPVVPVLPTSVPVVTLAPDTLPAETPAVVPVNEPLPLPPPIRPAAQTVDQPEEYYDDEPEYRRGMSIWAILLIVLVVLGAVAFAVYKYKPQWLHLNRGEQMELPAEKVTPVVKRDSTDSVKKVVQPSDTTKKAISKPDSALSKTAAVTDTVVRPEFAIFVGSFKTASKSQLFIKDLKRRGVEAAVLTGPGTGPRIKVIIGGFISSAEAEVEKTKLINSKKISKDSYSQQLTNPQK